MQRIFLFIPSTLLMLIMLAWSAWAETGEGVVTHVLDGDSFRVRIGRATTTIRLYGVDCPEYRQAGWRQAKKMTLALVKGRRVAIQAMDVDRYGRTVALVKVDGQLLNAELVRHGWAWVYHRYCHAQPLCRQMNALEKEARLHRRGLWQEKNPVSPWAWKHQTH
ncbi:thermonuclease family protein [Desulfobulbus propionicus]|jgi:endonuclease YncB( thermonuclease family)